MRKKIFQQIKKEIKKAKTALIISHVDPDGDAIGSAMSLAMLLSRFNVEATLYSEDGLPKVYRFLPLADKIKTSLPQTAYFDLVFTVDSSDIKRAGVKIKLKKLAPVIINIDHHPDNTLYGNINYVEKISSVAEQIYLLSKYLKLKLDKRIADCLYVAMITDTGNFRYENTKISTFNMAADLLACGVNPQEITTRIYDSKSITSIKINSAALSQIEFSKDKKIVWTAVSDKMMQEAGAKSEDMLGLVDQLRAIEGIEVAILFRQEKEKVKINFRSKYKVNVSEVAKRFGGGGHIKAAGAVVAGPLENVIGKVVSETIKYLEASKYLI